MTYKWEKCVVKIIIIIIITLHYIDIVQIVAK